VAKRQRNTRKQTSCLNSQQLNIRKNTSLEYNETEQELLQKGRKAKQNTVAPAIDRM
jgi:23S rRNA maturation mini-RNase III